jgi:hypothetical protein
MTLGSLGAVGAVTVVATAANPVWFTIGWVLAGMTMATVLDAPAFAAVTGWRSRRGP